MITVFVVFTLLYFGLTAFLFAGWESIPPPVGSEDVTPCPVVSVVIPVRNEAENIGKLLNDLGDQEYPNENYEVIVVDDQSEDETVDIVNAIVEKTTSNVKLYSLQNPANISHKKAAITQAISKAKGEWIICTDGDCSVQPSWLKSYAQLMVDDNLQMITGPGSTIMRWAKTGRFTQIQFRKVRLSFFLICF